MKSLLGAILAILVFSHNTTVDAHSLRQHFHHYGYYHSYNCNWCGDDSYSYRRHDYDRKRDYDRRDDDDN